MSRARGRGRRRSAAIARGSPAAPTTSAAPAKHVRAHGAGAEQRLGQSAPGEGALSGSHSVTTAEPATLADESRGRQG
jgi:hypothetical protein